MERTKDMTQQQTEALATLREWREGIQKALTENEAIKGDFILLMSLVGIRGAMDGVLEAF